MRLGKCAMAKIHGKIHGEILVWFWWGVLTSLADCFGHSGSRPDPSLSAPILVKRITWGIVLQPIYIYIHVKTILNRTYILINSTYISMPRLTWTVSHEDFPNHVLLKSLLALVALISISRLVWCTVVGLRVILSMLLSKIPRCSWGIIWWHFPKKRGWNWWIFPFVKNLSTCESQHPSDL